MRCFLDTNVFVAAILDTDEAEATGTATALLNAKILAYAREYDATLVSFDSELINAGAEHPADVIVG